MVSQESLPVELTTVLESHEFDDEAGLLIESVKFKREDLLLTFSINFYENTPQQIWQVNIENVTEEKISRNWSQKISLYHSHPLLLGVNDIYTELYFNGVTSKPKELFIHILECIGKEFNQKEYIIKYAPSIHRIYELTQQGYGLFDRGPKTILLICQQCLLDYGIKAYFVGEIKPSLQKQKLKLFKLGESYVIGQSFSFKRLH